MLSLGFWRSDLEPEWPDPRAFIDPSWDPEDMGVVAAYLDAGYPAESYGGRSTCRICLLPLPGNHDLTDGFYLWPEALSHYLRVHAVRLPDQFVYHVLHRRHLPRRVRDALFRWSGVGFLQEPGWWRTSHGWTVSAHGDIT